MISIRIKPDGDGILDGIKMRTVDLFGWTRASPVLVTQETIAAGTPSAGSLTIFDATACSAGDDYCQFSSILFVSSYTTLGVVVGSRIVSMLFDGARRLADNAGGRCSLQEADEAAGISESDLSV